MSRAAREFFHRHRLTVDDYQRMGEAGILDRNARVELIAGEIIDMAPIGSLHAGTVKRLIRMLERTVGDAAVLSVQDPIVLGPYSEPEPDVALLKPREDFYTTAHPVPDDVLLIIEVADTTVRYDREVKVPHTVTSMSNVARGSPQTLKRFVAALAIAGA
ncbi:MAG: Uma2 family endonuclease [Pseudomonadota bacterium]|nr:Uma2 family endonuclease [Pseudomonadota bacterium]